MRHSIGVIFILLLFGCDDESVLPPSNTDTSAGDVLVINEGGFQRGNASLGLYNFSTNSYVSNVYKNVNQQPVGDVFQSVASHNGEYWLVVNNSGKIIVIDSIDLKIKHEITGFKSPRYVHFYKNTKAFVSDLYGNEIAVVNTQTYRIDNYIPIDGWTDQMNMVDDRLFVANRERPFVFVVDPIAEVVVDSISVAHNPNSLTVLRNNLVAVLCEGRLGSNDAPKFQLIHPDSLRVVNEVSLDIGGKPSLLRVSPVNGNIYFAFKGIHYIHPLTYKVENKIIDMPESNVYGFDIDPITGNFYFSDAKDYLQKSDVYVYKGETKVNQFVSGIITNGFVFR